MHIGQNGGYGKGVGNIGFATTTALAFMCLFGLIIRALYIVDLCRCEIAL
jgi:hypothetical protein